MAHPPSYEDAVGQKDWLDTVAPYVAIKDYRSLCLVCKRFYSRFAPRLWKDPLQTVRALGLDQGDGKICLALASSSFALLMYLYQIWIGTLPCSGG